MYYALAENVPGLKNKISLFVALGSVTKLSNSFAPYFQYTIFFYPVLDFIFDILNINELLSYDWKFSLGSWFCEIFTAQCKRIY